MENKTETNKKSSLVARNEESRIEVTVGDLVLLSNPQREIEISGYVVDSSYETIILSHEDPTKKSVGCHLNGRWIPFKGNRSYWLSGFTDYEILRKADREGGND